MSRACKIVLAVAVLLISAFVVGKTQAGEIEILVQKLVEKGILTCGEAQQILTETKEEMRKAIAKGEADTLPKWIQKIKLKGDLRIRYQWEDFSNIDSSLKNDRHRGRFRFRLGVEGKVNPKLKVHAGLATGSPETLDADDPSKSDPRSTNQSFDETFSSKNIWLDYAYAEYTPTLWATMRMGKIKAVKKQLFRPTDLLWDSDINPEGVSLLFTAPQKFADSKWWLNTGVWVIEESSTSSDDPWMFYVQPGVTYKGLEKIFGKKSHIKAGVTWYEFQNSNGAAWTWSGSGNVGTPDFDAIVAAVEMRMADPIGKVFPDFAGKIPFVTLFWEYVKNTTDPIPISLVGTGTSEEDVGYAFGIKIGDRKIKDWGNWQLKYLYRFLEANAWPDAFPDSDAQGGNTDIEGHEIVFEYGIGKNTSIGLDYYYIVDAHLDGDRRHLLQVDWKMKF